MFGRPVGIDLKPGEPTHPVVKRVVHAQPRRALADRIPKLFAISGELACSLGIPSDRHEDAAEVVIQLFGRYRKLLLYVRRTVLECIGFVYVASADGSLPRLVVPREFEIRGRRRGS